jgi:hypothetical protein
MKADERILAVFEGKPRDRVPWNIRPEFWYKVNKAQGTLPSIYQGMSLIEVCRDWGASWRCYSGYFGDIFVKVTYEDVKFTKKTEDSSEITLIETPVGTLRQVSVKDELGFSSRTMEYLVKGLEDLKPLRYMLENVEVRFNHETYQKMKDDVGDDGIVSCCFPRSPLQRLMLNYAGVERAIKLLFRYPPEIEAFMDVVSRSNDQFYEVLGSSPIKLLNLGENIDSRITSPKLFKKYCLPCYQTRCEYLHKRNKFVHIHVDGWAKPLLPLLRGSGVDGVEALTVKPVGDMTLEDIKEALGDEIVLLDGIPYIYFVPDAVSLREFDNFVRKIITMFPDNLVLGISDELPPPGDGARVKRVSEIISKEFTRR